MKDNELTCSLDYEAEYERQRQLNEKLMAENEWLRNLKHEAEQELCVYKAKMEVVELIFGKRG